MAICASYASFAQTPVYSINFESGLTDETIVGTGEIVSDNTEGFGKVFHNVGSTGTEAIRSNYLLLPSNVFSKVSDAGTNELSISFWVNRGTSSTTPDWSVDPAVLGYWFTPLFSAYGDAPASGANTWPMFILQSRMTAQVNCAGWCNFEAAQNDNGSNLESTDWLNDGNWHFYTAVYTTSSLKIYVDGEVKNAWTVDNTSSGQVVGGLLTNGAELDYICLGGNQAWDWADIDAAFKYDDVAIYAEALTQAQINGIIQSKPTNNTATAVDDIIYDKGDIVSTEYFSISGSKAGYNYKELQPGIYIKKVTYDNGSFETTKICKEKLY